MLVNTEYIFIERQAVSSFQEYDLQYKSYKMEDNYRHTMKTWDG